ncbi:IS3 family transposase [Variovorax sp. E3]|uniref:IS3 family transposase n=1 Tax=Variovorax sp. E3 TaxID=1914993 RepID=UPI0022B7504E|nr:IS3 family transposase [Variovorax sp. E3]
MADIFERNHRCYGYRRMRASLSSQCVHICEKVVLRLMKHERLVAATPKRRRYGSYLGEISPAPENLFNRDFTAGAPTRNGSPMSRSSTFRQARCLSPLIDCFDGKVVGWTIGMRPNAQLVNTMLDAAIETIDISSNRPVVHSDRGGHYRWPGWLARITDAELTRSMSCQGLSPDNAACQGFFGRLKTKCFYPGNWQSTTVEQFTQAWDSAARP